MTTLRFQELYIPREPEDLSRIDEHQRQMIELDGDFLGIPPDPHNYLRITEGLTPFDRTFAGVLDSGASERVIASARYSPKQHYVEIKSLVVEEQYRRNRELRVGSFMLESLVQVARQDQYSSIRLTSLPIPELIAFYERNHFTSTDQIRRIRIIEPES